VPIPLPNLDDRRWADLVDQGRALIPLYAPEWTDHNASDPGITLMELFAWIAEMDVYRLNRIPDRHKRRLLALMGVRPTPPRPARGAVELRLPAGAAPVNVPAGTEFSGAALDGGALTFRSTVPLTATSCRLRAVQRRTALGLQNLTAIWTRGEEVTPFGDEAAVGAELYLGFDAPLPAGRWTSLYVALGGGRTGPDERARILEDRGTSTLPPHHGARVTWEYLTTVAGAPRWQTLEADDDTRSLTLDGAVRLRPGQDGAAEVMGQVPGALYYVRCRFEAGAYDAPPSIRQILPNAVEVEQAAPLWQRLTIAKGATASGSAAPGDRLALRLTLKDGEIQSLALAPAGPDEPSFVVLGYVPATASVAGSLTLEAQLAGTGTGEPNQTVLLARRPVVEPSVEVYGLEGATWRRWERVDDVAASSRSDAHFRLDPTSGLLTFGDGERGRAVPPGSPLLAVYDATAASPDPARISAVADSPHNRAFLTAPGATALSIGEQVTPSGGEPPETLAHAIGRAIELREASLRAVTAHDFEVIALETPGTRIARAAAWPNLYPGVACVRAPGVVTVIVLPAMPGGRPTPSPGLLRTVAARLERRRVLGTRVMVIGPRYLEVSVKARVRALEGVSRPGLSARVRDALDRFFHPLAGGPDATGWPFGRDVFRSEVLQVIDETEGVDHVLSLELLAEGCPPTCGNLCLPATWLPAAGPHDIEVV
jgi:hypothetical protein